MHKEVHQFIRKIRMKYPRRFFAADILEVGSHDINGSPRSNFWFCNYVGIDVSEGKGVDIVSRFIDMDFGWRRFDTVISTECLEHDETWRHSLQKMYDLLKPNGLLLITCAGPDRREHGTKRTTPFASPDTTDYYRNISRQDLKSVLRPDMFRDGDYLLQYARGENDLQFYGIKNK